MASGTQLNLSRTPEPSSTEPTLALLPAIESGRTVFFRNLGDFLCFRDWPRPFDRSRYEGWLTNYVLTAPAWTRIRESYWGHVLVVVATFAICTSAWFLEPPVRPISPFEHAHIQYYPTSDYLPAINSKAPRPHTSKKADPVYAKQEIISVRPNADNHTQTVITPPNVKLQHDVPLPNMAVWTSDPVAPTAASPAVQPKMTFPLAAQVVEPTPDISKLRDKRTINLQSSAVEPVANDRTLRPNGQLNVSALQPSVVAPAPSLPVPAQRASGLTVGEVVPPAPTVSAKKSGVTGIGSLQPQAIPPAPNAPGIAQHGVPNGTPQPQVVPPQPSVGGIAGSNGKPTGQIIALSVHPTDVHGPISVPAGNRNGEFSAGPSGRPGATGQPESSGNESGPGAGKNGNSSGAGNGSGKENGPAGIYVSAPPEGANPAPVVGKTPSPAPATTEMAKLQFPKMQHATVADLAKATKPMPATTAPEARNPLADKVFAGKRYYALTLNMPNLNSSTGSWVVRFAELNDRRDGIPVLAPVATSKLDPVYPQALVHYHIEGTVTLYAVIRQDGTVADIKVLRSLDKDLDYSAMRALAGWRFVPGMKNGTAVDLEAIVDIPFHLKPINP
ncbi:TonB-like protein [Candidatus Koribacter versatilis Ellin345]|uniref:TonB-like protein n=1 Tax=Koribacter versatilis (strain Ellin345) TaxID=204669 RepID=Q1ITI5_KORVE|nr:energy transducer TonB [Candidatus Koribacter versatilis]ABF39815.1 TonB-like protein [Candidatus Koribacter versatilis Ellin345]